MDLILWRHADAGEPIAEAAADLARPLSSKGRKQAKAMAAWLRKQLQDVDDYRLIASEAVRSRETAEFLGKYSVAASINPGGFNGAYLEVAHWPRDVGKTVVIVGHQPHIGQVASLLLTGKELDWTTRKSGIWWIQRRIIDDRIRYVLKAAIGPEML